MQARAAIRVPQGFVRGHIKPASIAIPSKRGATRKVTPSFGAPAFLTQKIADIRPAESDIADGYGINLDKSYEHLLKCCMRFSQFVGLKFDFAPQIGYTKPQKICSLIDYFVKLIEPLGLEFFVSKKSPQGDEVNVMECAVYRYGRELEESVVVLYVSPARYLTPRSAELYKRFMKFFSDSTHIPLGTIDNRENLYIDSILSIYDYDPYYSELTEDDDDYPEVAHRREIAAAYKEDGEFWNLFDEIQCLPKQNAKQLYKDLDEYRKDCPIKEVDLIECLAEGIDIIKDMNIYWFEFNPEDNGLPDDYGNMDGDDWASSVFASAILYSEQDGICEMLLESINSEVNACINMSGWNIHQYLSPTMRKADIMDFMRCRDRVGEFSKWIRDYYTNIEEFDRYGKFDKPAE